MAKAELFDFSKQVLCKICGRMLLSKGEQEYSLCADCLQDQDTIDPFEDHEHCGPDRISAAIDAARDKDREGGGA